MGYADTAWALNNVAQIRSEKAFWAKRNLILGILTIVLATKGLQNLRLEGYPSRPWVTLLMRPSCKVEPISQEDWGYADRKKHQLE